MIEYSFTLLCGLFCHSTCILIRYKIVIIIVSSFVKNEINYSFDNDSIKFSEIYVALKESLYVFRRGFVFSRALYVKIK